jgi:hypothetical protein
MRRASTVVLVFLAIQWIAPPAHGQDQPATGSIRLLAQTPWTENEDPELRIRVRIRNDGVLPIETPAVGWVLGEAIGARADYEAALRDGPSSTAAADTRFLDAPLGPGQVEDVLLQIRTVSYDAVSKTDSGVYPLKVELRSAGIVIASLMTAEIHLVQDPRAPIALSWWTEIDVPIAFRPDGSLLDPGFEESLENRSGVVAQLEALVELGSRPRRAGVRAARFDVVVTPTALDQLEEAADGYLRPDGSRATAQDPAPAAASDAIRLLRELAEAPGVRLHATPFSGPRLPALLAAPLLAPDLEDQWRFGNEIFERILGEPPDPTVARPPALAIDGETLDALFVRRPPPWSRRRRASR